MDVSCSAPACLCSLASPARRHASPPALARQASKLEQYWLTVSLDTLLPAMWNIVEQQASVPNSKIIVFFVTARCTQFFAEFFNSGGIEVMEIHSRKSQSARSKTSERFRNAKQAVLFTSDVSGAGPTHPTPRPISEDSLVVARWCSARGMDYPDVSFVLQVGAPSSKEQYVHRTGRSVRQHASNRHTDIAAVHCR